MGRLRHVHTGDMYVNVYAPPPHTHTHTYTHTHTHIHTCMHAHTHIHTHTHAHHAHTHNTDTQHVIGALQQRVEEAEMGKVRSVRVVKGAQHG